jgi:hypothetical protein
VVVTREQPRGETCETCETTSARPPTRKASPTRGSQPNSATTGAVAPPHNHNHNHNHTHTNTNTQFASVISARASPSPPATPKKTPPPSPRGIDVDVDPPSPKATASVDLSRNFACSPSLSEHSFDPGELEPHCFLQLRILAMIIFGCITSRASPLRMISISSQVP